MYDSQNIAFLIKKTAKEKNITIKQLLETCNLNINTVSELSKGKQISYLNFATIADCLGVSVDYLLGRTGTPDINLTDKIQADFFKIFQKLPFEEQVNLMNIALEKVS